MYRIDTPTPTIDLKFTIPPQDRLVAPTETPTVTPDMVLDTAADLIIQRGLHRGTNYGPNGTMCMVAAVTYACREVLGQGDTLRVDALGAIVLPHRHAAMSKPGWNDRRALGKRHVAHVLRRSARLYRRNHKETS